MKKVFLISAVSVAFVFVFTACGSKTASTSEQTEAKKLEYTCPMHPDVISDKEGACPKCGMALELKK